MKDAQKPKPPAFDLWPIELFTDGDGELVSSLVVQDLLREARDLDPELAGVKHLIVNNAALWQSIRNRKAKGGPCNRFVLRDDMIVLMGKNGRKGFTRWLEKLVRDGIIEVDVMGGVTVLKSH